MEEWIKGNYLCSSFVPKTGFCLFEIGNKEKSKIYMALLEEDQQKYAPVPTTTVDVASLLYISQHVGR